MALNAIPGNSFQGPGSEVFLYLLMGLTLYCMLDRITCRVRARKVSLLKSQPSRHYSTSDKEKNTMKKILFIGLLSALAVSSCEINDNAPLTMLNTEVGDVDPSVLNPAIGAFGWEALQQTVQQADETKNTIISPFSIAVALYMTYNGADGETKQAMDKALQLNGLSPDSLNVAVSNLFNLLEDTQSDVRLTSANAVFWDEVRLSPFEDFLTKMTSFYQAETIREDFENRPEVVLDRINTWVHNQTKGRIEKILDELNPEEILFLVNALYFIGDWEQPFDDQTTSDQAFTLSNGSEIKVPTMYQDDDFTYYNGDDFKGVTCHFADTNYAMLFVLPPDEEPIDDFLANQSYGQIIERFETNATSDRIMLLLPKFEVNYKINLNKVLKSMGMSIAFDESRANFSKLGTSTYGNTFLSRVEHKTYLKIDEKGAEGAAVTAVGIGVTSLPPVFHFNRPFAVLLVHQPSQTPIFIGKIEHPLEVEE